MNVKELPIEPPDERARKQAQERWDGLAKPLGSLGLLEDAVTRIAALTGTADVHMNSPALLVYCADNGVTAQGVSQSDASVTRAVARALGAGESTVCYMAEEARCRVVPVDVGIRDFPGAAGVLDRRIQNGTQDITQGPAMTRETCLRAIALGVQTAAQMKDEGADILAAGEMGIGNTTTAAAVTAVLLGLPAETVTGRGAGLSDAGLSRKRAAIAAAIQKNRPDPEDPVDVLSKVGGLDLAAMCGTFLGGAVYRIPVLADGAVSAAAALCAVRLRPEAGQAVLASHLSPEPVSRLLLDEMGLHPLLSAEMRLGEGGGAVAVLPLLRTALAVYHSGHTFAALGIDAYTPQQRGI